jgi:hypothetical protein
MLSVHLREHPASYLKDYQSCAAISTRMGQAAVAHPLLFHALVTGYGSLERRIAAVAAIERGDKLRDACRALSIPYAMRSVPASSLLKPLQPAVISEHGARLAALRIGRLPKRSDQDTAIQALFYGTSVSGEDFGLWLAHPGNLSCLPNDLMMVRSLAFYAWQSRQDADLPVALRHLSFSPMREWSSNVRSAMLWYQYFKFAAYFGDAPITDMWAEPYRCGDYDIVPLRTAQQLLDEVIYMDNCLRTYADSLHFNICRLFSVRRDGNRLGTVEIQPRRDGRLRAVQFRGPRNAVMAAQPWDAVHDWISRQKPLRARPCSDIGTTRVVGRFPSMLKTHQATHDLPEQFWIGIDSLKRLEAELGLLTYNPFKQRHTRL